MTSSNGNIFRVTGPLCGEFTGPGEFPTQRPVTRSFDVLFDLRLNKRLSKQPWGWWFETPCWSLWHQRNAYSLSDNCYCSKGILMMGETFFTVVCLLLMRPVMYYIAIEILYGIKKLVLNKTKTSYNSAIKQPLCYQENHISTSKIRVCVWMNKWYMWNE